jgi:hypothetical protein
MATHRQIAERSPASFAHFVQQMHAGQEHRDSGFYLSVAIAAGLLWLVLALH